MEETRHPIQVLQKRGPCHLPWAYVEGVLMTRYGQSSPGMDRPFCSFLFSEPKTQEILVQSAAPLLLLPAPIPAH